MKSPVDATPVQFNKRFGGRDSAKTLFRFRDMKRYAIAFIVLLVAGCGRQNVQNEPAQPDVLGDSIRSIIAKQLNVSPDAVRDDATFASLGADDLDLVEVTMAVEDAHGIVIRDDGLTVAAGVTKAEQLVPRLTVGTFISVAAASEKQPPPQPGEEKPPVGAYADLAKLNLRTDQAILFVPSLASVLARSEVDAGRPLTESEVLAIRDRSPAMALPISVMQEMTQSRGYTDIAPEHCWEQWQEMRKKLQKEMTEQDKSSVRGKPRR